MQRRQWWRYVVCAMLAAGAPHVDAADPAWPTRPIRIVVPTPPGGATDLATRIIAPPLAERLGQPVIVENRPGASGAIGADVVAKAEPDGYTLLMIIDQNAILPFIRRNLNHDLLKSFADISMVGKGSIVLVAYPPTPYNTIPALVAYAKAHPGTLSYASPGTGTSTHLAGELLKQATGLSDLQHVPYKGGGEAMSAVLGGQVPLAMLGMAPALAQIKAGKLKALAVSGPVRATALPDVPTMKEAGFPTLVLANWLGLVAPAGTPPAVVAKLHAALADTLGMPAVVESFDKLALVPSPSPTPDAMHRELDSEMKRWGAVVKAAGVEPE
ncbi:MAG: tripartite tricarboxylate transporter substrate binding protein [Proteobacteria bacterium]|nr:tripartite tricarboxylate transporter substrate binding protein [Pseudomonadota bacterium]